MESTRENIHLGAGRTFRLLRWNHSVSQVEVVEAGNRAVPVVGQGNHWHYHRATELTLILRGSGTRFVADHIELFDSGDLVLIGSNVPHYWHQRGESKGLSLQWDFPPEHGIWNFAETAPLRRLEEIARRGVHVGGNTALSTRRHMERLGGTSGLERLAIFLGILSGLESAPPRDIRLLAPRPFSLSGSAEHQEAITRVVSYILAHYREPLHLGELLSLVSMSRPTFARQFRRHAGRSFSMFLNQIRLQAVCQALRNTSEPIGAIALNHGFNNLSFFNRLFRREFKANPSHYRARGHRRNGWPDTTLPGRAPT